MISGNSPEDTHDRYERRHVVEWHPLHEDDTHHDDIEEEAVRRHLSRVATRDGAGKDADENEEQRREG